MGKRKLKLIKKLDRLFFAYGNAIDDCLEDKDCEEASKLLEEFFKSYTEIRGGKFAL